MVVICIAEMGKRGSTAKSTQPERGYVLSAIRVQFVKKQNFTSDTFMATLPNNCIITAC